MPRVQTLVWFVLACWAVACSSCTVPSSNDPVIAKYEAAACIPFSATPKVMVHTREWDSNLKLRDGTGVIIRGAQIPGGRVTVFYPGTGQEVVAADPEDYVYPSDVRFDAQHDLLYVKAHGLAGGFFEQTWLFEYDVRTRRIVERLRVRNNILAAECQEDQKH